MTRFVCIHGHFYQPPRENPWLDVVERQESAAPFHDWNARITAECYRPNARARVLDGRGRIDHLVNDYARISFNVGPTLMSWLAQSARDVHDAIIEADRRALARTGAGAAMAQVHGHLILPLANERDQRTQVRWGARDFELRFGRRPRGMWLAETACDTASLEALAYEGIEFTVLAPSQAARVRPRATAPWLDVHGARVDPRRPYRVRLPSGRSIVVFFYDGPTSRAIAFENLLDDGAVFADRLRRLFREGDEDQLAHVATDGETYGHHHRFGEMALAYALDELDRDPSVQLVSYEGFLNASSVEWEAEIVENTAWSCAHGVERWRGDCGCSSGAHPSWSQAWRTPLRRGLDALRDRVSELFDERGRALFLDPWAARDAYVDVLAAQSPEETRAAQRALLDRHVRPEIREAAPDADGRALERAPEWVVRALRSLELVRHAMSMFTSCAFFFDDISGIETTQGMAYAARVAELARELWQIELEPSFVEALALARSNVPGEGTGADVYRAHVSPRAVSLDRAAAHFAVSSLFHDYDDHEILLGFEVDFDAREVRSSGRARLAMGLALVTERATRASLSVDYAVIHLGDHHLGVGVRPALDEASRALVHEELAAAFESAELTQMLSALQRHFPPSPARGSDGARGGDGTRGASYSLRSLFKDEQKHILDLVLASTLESVEHSYALIHEQHAPLMRYLTSLGQEVPRPLRKAAEYTLSRALQRELGRGPAIELANLEALAEEARATGVLHRGGSGAPPDAEESDLAVHARRALIARIKRAGEPDASLDELRLAARLARFLAENGTQLDAGSTRDEAVLLRDRWIARGIPDDVRPVLEELLDTLAIAPAPRERAAVDR